MRINYRTLLLILLVIFAVSLLGLGVFYYLSVIRTNPSLQNQVRENLPAAKILIPKKEDRFIFNSEINGYEISIQNEKELEKILTEWGIFNLSGAIDISGSQKSFTIRKITVSLLSSFPQIVDSTTAIRDENNATVSWANSIANIDSGEVTFNIYFRPEWIKDANNAFAANLYLNRQFLRLLYELSLRNVDAVVGATSEESSKFLQTNLYDKVNQMENQNDSTFPLKINKRLIF